MLSVLQFRLRHCKLYNWNSSIYYSRLFNAMSESSSASKEVDLKEASYSELEKLIPIIYDLRSRIDGSLSSIRVRHIPSPSYSSNNNSVTYSEVRGRKVKSSQDSWLELHYPFSTDPLLQERYRLFDTAFVRFGLILEDMDALAGDISLRHIGILSSDVMVVTASVDQIKSNAEMVSIHRDMWMEGFITWVGKTSMEILIRLSTTENEKEKGGEGGGERQKYEEEKGNGKKKKMSVIEARFVMVARKKDENLNSGVEVYGLKLENEQDKVLFQIGSMNNQKRKMEREKKLNGIPPSPQELLLLHNLFLKSMYSTRGSTPGSGNAILSNFVSDALHVERRNAATWQFMHETIIQKTLLMHSQKRNINGFIFGGFVMREAFELAWICARLHSRLLPIPAFVDDVSFISPIPIGTILEFSAQVIYVEDNLVRVLVIANKLSTKSRSQSQSQSKQATMNNYQFAFKCIPASDFDSTPKNSSETPEISDFLVKSVRPHTYEDALNYLEGYRKHNRDKLT